MLGKYISLSLRKDAIPEPLNTPSSTTSPGTLTTICINFARANSLAIIFISDEKIRSLKAS